jgi:hypothetical protein
VKQISAIIGFAVVAIAACASGGSSSPEHDEFTLPSGSSDGVRPSPAAGLRSVTGVLSFDDIEGGCAFLQTATGTRFEVIYPDGWQLDRSAAVLRGPAGERAHAGETLTVRGAIATDRSSICQIGPIFRATSVEIAHG